jgi:sialic acid synthase SpsE
MKKIDFIAEVSSNHNNDLNRMKEFIYASRNAGCTGVKFQLFKIDELFAPEILKSSKTHQERKKWELNENYIPELSKLTRSLGMKFCCTPFYLEAVDFLEPYVDFYKIASYELLWEDLFRKCIASGKPIVFSTGMSTIDEVKSTMLNILEENCKDITILHCNSAYPTPIKDVNLSAINPLRKMIENLQTPLDVSIKIGYSDHTASPSVLYRVAHQHDISQIEFHIDLDGDGYESESGHCWVPEKIKEVIDNINNGFLSDGSGIFGPSESELPDRNWRADPKDGLRPMKELRRE